VDCYSISRKALHKGAESDVLFYAKPRRQWRYDDTPHTLIARANVKPYRAWSQSTYAATALEHGSGALWIDGGRVGTELMGGYEVKPGGMLQPSAQRASGYRPKWDREDKGFTATSAAGRWPANLILSYPEDKYILRDDVTAEQLHRLAEWMDENA